MGRVVRKEQRMIEKKRRMEEGRGGGGARKGKREERRSGGAEEARGKREKFKHSRGWPTCDGNDREIRRRLEHT